MYSDCKYKIFEAIFIVLDPLKETSSKMHSIHHLRSIGFRNEMSWVHPTYPHQSAWARLCAWQKPRIASLLKVCFVLAPSASSLATLSESAPSSLTLYSLPICNLCPTPHSRASIANACYRRILSILPDPGRTVSGILELIRLLHADWHHWTNYRPVSVCRLRD